MISALDNHLLRAYLDGEMDEAAAEAFEILMIERPELAELVDADTALQLGLAAEAAQAGPAATQPAPGAAGASPAQAADSADAVSSGVPATATPLPPNPHARSGARRSRVLPLLAAASLLVVVGMGLGRLLPEAGPALRPATLVSVDRLRSLAQTQKLVVPATGLLVLSVPVAAAEGCAARVQIRQATALLDAPATADAYGFANLALDAAQLQNGKAEVVVLCDDKETARYPVELSR